MVSINFEGAKQFYASQPDKAAAQAAFDTLVNGTGAGNDFIHHHFCETVMLKFRINGEVDDMKSSGFMKLGGPSGVEVIFSEDKVENVFIVGSSWSSQPSVMRLSFRLTK